MLYEVITHRRRRCVTNQVEDGSMAETQAGNNQGQPQQQFAMQRIYTRDVSLESPSAPQVFRKQWQPKVNVDLGTKSDRLDEQGNFSYNFV